jgi:hypothetical protein
MRTEQELNLIFNKGGGYCFYCGTSITRSSHGPMASLMRITGAWEVEHWIPKSTTSSAAAEQADNLVPACCACNDEKGTMAGESYIRWRWSMGKPVRRGWKDHFGL